MESYQQFVVFRCDLKYQELMRDAANERIAARAQRSKPSPLAWVRTATHVAASWMRGRLLHMSGAQRRPPGSAVTSV